MKDISYYRDFLKSYLWEEWDVLERDQEKGVPQPAPQKPYPEDAELVELLSPQSLTVGNMPLKEVIGKRRSRRRYTDQPLTLEELSYLLWATQGLSGGKSNLRSVPSAGGRHPFETYLFINRVERLKKGLYRYLPLDHKLLPISDDPELLDRVVDACCSQKFVGGSAVVFIWTAIPYRSEWRYNIIAHKMIAMDAGHLCQNLYLASESIGGGACAIGKYNQEKMDALLGMDGTEEFTIYAATVGKVE
jgi:SagB-type dehydrogenase family enzyme